MYYVYIIKSLKHEKIYTGLTIDLKSRITEHNKGLSRHTKKYFPWELIWYSAFVNKYKAAEFEQYLKTASGIAFRNKHLV